MFTDGVVCGVNSAVTDAFGSPRSIASMLYPMLFQQLRFGVSMGAVRLNASRPMIDLIFEGTIPTDGSEELIAVCHDAETGSFSVSPKTPVAMAEYVHDDFPSFQQGKTAIKQTKQTYRLRRVEQPDGRDEAGE
jgi:hypothetical protein